MASIRARCAWSVLSLAFRTSSLATDSLPSLRQSTVVFMPTRTRVPAPLAGWLWAACVALKPVRVGRRGLAWCGSAAS